MHRGMVRERLSCGVLQNCVLTTGQFFEHVLARQPRTAAFDCDGTLWSNNAGTGFMEWEIAQGVLSSGRAEELLRWYALYERGEVGEVEMCGKMVSCHAGLREAEVIAAAERYAESTSLRIFFRRCRNWCGGWRRAVAICGP